MQSLDLQWSRLEPESRDTAWPSNGIQVVAPERHRKPTRYDPPASDELDHGVSFHAAERYGQSRRRSTGPAGAHFDDADLEDIERLARHHPRQIMQPRGRSSTKTSRRPPQITSHHGSSAHKGRSTSSDRRSRSASRPEREWNSEVAPVGATFDELA